MKVIDSRLIEQSEAHVVVRLLGLLFLLLLLLGGRSLGGGGRGGTASRSRAHRRAHVAQQRLDVGRLQSLGEQARPVGLHADVGRLQESLDLLRLKQGRRKINYVNVAVSCIFFCKCVIRAVGQCYISENVIIVVTGGISIITIDD